MKHPQDLGAKELAAIVERLQQLLYLDEQDGQPVWNLDKEWANVDILVNLADLLGQFDLVPD